VAPQLPQNLAPGRTGLPQLGQVEIDMSLPPCSEDPFHRFFAVRPAARKNKFSVDLLLRQPNCFPAGQYDRLFSLARNLARLLQKVSFLLHLSRQIGFALRK
jgi:hypothetical protein